MEFKGPMLVVKDIEKSRKFYNDTLGLHVVVDFGANITLTGGLSLQAEDVWAGFLKKSKSEIRYGGDNVEIYFEEDNLDSFIKKLNAIENIEYVAPLEEASWGQRAVKFYDLDKHIIEVGENLKSVCKRFIDRGLTVEETAERMDVQEIFVRECIK